MASFFVPDEYGNKKRKSVYGKTEQEAREKMEEALKSIEDKGTWDDNTKLTFNQWLDKWIEDYKKPFIKISTLENYLYMINGHIRPVLGEKKLKSINNNHIQKFISSKVGDKSPKTVKLIFTIINDTLNQAKYAGIIKDNPAENVKLPKQEQKETKYLSPEDIEKLLDEAAKSKHHTAILFDLYTGLRRGELLGLEWKHIDFKNNTIKIEQALTKTKTEGVRIGKTQTKNSQRVIAVKETLMKELKRHSWKQKEYKDKLGELYNTEYDLVFCKEDGSPLCPASFSKTFKKLANRAGFEGVSFHGLRHTAATLLIENGVDLKTVSAGLGHSNIGITGNIYAHCTDKMKDKAAEVMEEALTRYIK